MSNLTKISEDISIDHGLLIGRGSTGNVYLGQSQKYPHRKYAVKAIDLSQVNNEVTKYLLSCEIAALSQLTKLKTKSVVKLQDVRVTPQFCYLAMELLQGGPLSQYIKFNPNGTSEQQALSLFRQMLQGYKAIKNLNIVHRDIKPDNLIFRQKYDQSQCPNKMNSKNICFIDFGYCTMQNVPNKPNVYYNVGSPKYMAPQAYRQNIYSQKSDVWALGVILYEMVHGKTIDLGMEMDQYIDFIRNNPIPVTRCVNQLIKSLLFGMLTFDHKKRMSCSDIERLLNSAQNLQQNSLKSFDQPQIIPQLAFTQSADKRNSHFYRSQVITSDRTYLQPLRVNHEQMLHFDPKRQQRNFSHENKLQEYSNSPKKMVHVEHSSQRIVQRVVNYKVNQNGEFCHNTIKRQITSLQRINPDTERNGPLKTIYQQFDNQASRSNLHKTFGPLQRQFDNRRTFLRHINQGQQLLNGQSNPNIRILNQKQFPFRLPSPVMPVLKNNGLHQSQIFPEHPTVKTNINTSIFFSTQANDVLPINLIKTVTSDKVININSHHLNVNIPSQSGNRNLNKSFSTNNVQHNFRHPKQQNLITHSTFTNNPPPNTPPINQFLRPVDLTVSSQQSINKRAFLRNTMPSGIYRSMIQNPTSPQVKPKTTQNPNDSFNLLDKSIIHTNITPYKNPGSYFNSAMNRAKEDNSQFRCPNLQTLGLQNQANNLRSRNQRGNSFRTIPQNNHIIHNNLMRPSQQGQYYHVNHVNQVNHANLISHVSHVNHANQINHVNHANLANHVSHVNQMNQVNHVNQMNHVNQTNHMSQFNPPSIQMNHQILNQRNIELRAQQKPNTLVRLSHERNNLQLQPSNVNDLRFDNNTIQRRNNVYDEEVRRTHMINSPQQTMNQRRVANFIIDRKNERIPLQNKSINQNLVLQQIRHPVFNPQPFRTVQSPSSSQNQFFVNHLKNNDINREMKHIVPAFYRPITLIHN